MKESKFIELLNLYVDQQIEPEEAALLEAEILRNPARRQVYQQYCRMQRACAMLVEQARPEVAVGAKLADTVAAADEKVMEFVEPRSTASRYLYLGGLAAACFTVIFFVGRSVRQSTLINNANREQIVQISPIAAPKDQATARKINYQPVLVTHSLRPSNGSSGNGATSVTNEQLSLDWINQVKFSPVSISNDELALGAPSSLKNNQRDAKQREFRNGPPAKEGEFESTAFSFRR